jgi:hypothetical protein
MIRNGKQRLPHVHHPFVVDGASGTLVGIPIAIMSNLLTGTQETKNPFESHKALRRVGVAIVAFWPGSARGTASDCHDVERGMIVEPERSQSDPNRHNRHAIDLRAHRDHLTPLMHRKSGSF